MLEMRLLELQTEFANHEDDAATLATIGLKPDRTREDIAREYGQVLREFLAS